MNEKDVPMIEQYKADNAIIHASRIVRDLKIIVAVGAALVLLIVFIFVSFYSNRQKEFLNTINMLIPKTVEVANGETMEQLPPP